MSGRNPPRKSQRTMEEEWQDFAVHTVPEDAPQHQHDQLRRAFYAGAWVAMELAFALDPGEEPTEADLAFYTARYNEVLEVMEAEARKSFARARPQGRA